MRYRLTRAVFAGAWALSLAGPAFSADNSEPSGSAAGGVILSDPPQGVLVTEHSKPPLNLSDEQRQIVIAEIITRDTHQAPPKEFKPEMGVTVSRFVDTHAMPPKLATVVPVLKEYTYAHLNRNIVIVDALDKKIAALIPLPDNLTWDGKKPDQKATAVKAVGGLGDLTMEQRHALYQSASGEAQPVPEQTMLAGVDVPDSLILQPLPAGIAAQISRMQEWQYAKLQDGRMLLIDPKTRKVAGIITQDEGMGTASASGNSAATSGVSGARANSGDPLRERAEDGKPSAYTGPRSRPN